MKKTLLLISHYFSNFLSVLLIFSLFLVYIMFKLPIIFWVGNMAGRTFTDNFGGLWVKFFDNDYYTFFYLPFMPFLGGFFLLSVFIWIYYRHDKEEGKVGFRNTILSVLVIFILILLPAQSSQLEHKIREQRDKQISELNSNGIVKLNKRLDKEILKLYQALYYEGILEWRDNPVAVVNYELENGDLKRLSRGQDRLTLQSVESDESSSFSHATVLLKNELLQAEIYLMSYWDSDGRVWAVKSYKEINVPKEKDSQLSQ